MTRARREHHLLPALLVVLAVLAAACADDPSAQARAGQRLTVVSTMSVFADFAAAVGGDRVEIETLVPVGGDPHTYEPRPSDAARIADADVVLDNGLGLSPWFEPLAGNVQGELVILTDGIAEQATSSPLGPDGQIDPHLWMVPPFVMDGYVTAIEEAFAAADPEGAGTYRDNAQAYRSELAALDEELAGRIGTIPEQHRKLVTSHDAYRYFANHYRLEVVGTVLGVTTEEEPSAQSVGRLVDQVREEQVPAIFVETTINPALIERVARDAGVDVGDPLYGDSVGEPGSGAEDYVGMMRANVGAITSALGGERR